MSSMEEIRDEILGLMEKEQLLAKSSHRLKCTVPLLWDNNPCWLFSDFVIGDSHSELSKKIYKHSFALDEQRRHVFAIIQAFGMGKTKLIISLTQDFVVLPIRTMTGREPISRMISIIETLRESDNFQQSAYRLMWSLFLSLIAFQEQAQTAFKEIEYFDRRWLAKVLMFNTKAQSWLAEWMMASQSWSENDFKIEKCRLLSYAANYPVKILLAFDEVHELVGTCSNFFLPRRESNESSKDLFYLFRSVIVDAVAQTPVPVGFVMTSTKFRTTEAMDIDKTPFRADLLLKYIPRYRFKFEDVLYTIQNIFKTPSIDDEAELLLKVAGRPLFTFKVLDELMDSIDSPANDAEWFRQALNSGVEAGRSLASQCIQKSLSRKLAVGTTHESFLLDLVFYSIRMCNCRVSIELIEEGFGILDGNMDHAAIISDPLFVESVLIQYHSKSPISNILKNFYDLKNFVMSDETSSKGFLFERAVAYYLMVKKCEVKIENCGTIDELEIRDEVSAFADPKYYNTCIFPTNAAGPDLWIRDDTYTVAVQCKWYKKHFTWVEFLSALKSVSPKYMFGSRKKSTAKPLAQQKKWRKIIPELCETTYLRIFVSFVGFTANVHFLVSEYNKTHQDRVILLTQNEIRSVVDLGDLNFEIKETPTIKIPDVELRLLSRSKREKTRNDVLKSWCSERGLAVSGRKTDLIQRLSDYLETHRKDLLDKIQIEWEV